VRSIRSVFVPSDDNGGIQLSRLVAHGGFFSEDSDSTMPMDSRRSSKTAIPSFESLPGMFPESSQSAWCVFLHANQSLRRLVYCRTRGRTSLIRSTEADYGRLCGLHRCEGARYRCICFSPWSHKHAPGSIQLCASTILSTAIARCSLASASADKC
jgi:hypothetical protein